MAIEEENERTRALNRNLIMPPEWAQHIVTAGFYDDVYNKPWQVIRNEAEALAWTNKVAAYLASMTKAEKLAIMYGAGDEPHEDPQPE